MSTVAAGKVVTFHYTLTNDGGEVLDSSRGGEPMPYLHGAMNIVPGLEKELAGKKVGDALKAVVSPEEGYGKHDPELLQEVGRDAFPTDVALEVGMQFMADTPRGQVPLWISDIDGDMITIDQNHPLAGETLFFDVEIVDIRDATAEEMQHGHPHGPHGHAH
jgi:FKBP-type peptidyl-prolyl cis-trans isomerase SlyD